MGFVCLYVCMYAWVTRVASQTPTPHTHTHKHTHPKKSTKTPGVRRRGQGHAAAQGFPQRLRPRRLGRRERAADVQDHGWVFLDVFWLCMLYVMCRMGLV